MELVGYSAWIQYVGSVRARYHPFFGGPLDQAGISLGSERPHRDIGDSPP